MPTNSNERRAYVPLSVLTDAAGALELSLDLLSATYSNIHDQNISSQTYQVTESEAGAPDAIADRFYGDSRLWWVICTFNSVIDPYTEITAGKRLLIPSLDEVMLYLTRDDVSASSTSNRVGSIGVL